MKSLREYIVDAEAQGVAIGHFNISDLAALKAIFESARELSLLIGREVPIIIGVSEGEREFVGVWQAGALVKSLREEFSYPIFLNADHTHSLENIMKAVEAGFDAVLFDAGALSLEENIKKTKEVVAYVGHTAPHVLVECELGFFGTSSFILKEVPKGAAISLDTITKPDVIARFVRETGVHLVGPAVGNLHGIFKDAPNPHLFIERIKELRATGGVPLVLHGGSGITNDDFTAAIKAGISIIHINTDIRVAWRKGLEEALQHNPEEIVPYKLLPGAINAMRTIILERLKLFNNLV